MDTSVNSVKGGGIFRGSSKVAVLARKEKKKKRHRLMDRKRRAVKFDLKEVIFARDIEGEDWGKWFFFLILFLCSAKLVMGPPVIFWPRYIYM